jgi:hypothetical protein
MMATGATGPMIGYMETRTASDYHNVTRVALSLLYGRKLSKFDEQVMPMFEELVPELLGKPGEFLASRIHEGEKLNWKDHALLEELIQKCIENVEAMESHVYTEAMTEVETSSSQLFMDGSGNVWMKA